MKTFWASIVGFFNPSSSDNFGAYKQYRTPFFGAFIFYLVLWNWELIFSLLNFDATQNRVERIGVIKKLIAEYSWCKNIGIPILLALVSLVVFYAANSIALAITSIYNKWIKTHVYKIVGSRQKYFLREEVVELSAENERLKELNNKYRIEISGLQKEVEDIQKQIQEENQHISNETQQRLNAANFELEKITSEKDFQINKLEEENKELRQTFANYDYDTDIVLPTIDILPREGLMINPDFILAQTGSFAAWVKLPPLKELYKEPSNNRYIIGHDTNKGFPKKQNSEYENAWAICLTPNFFDSQKKLPTAFYWTFWFTNANCEKCNLNSPVLEVKDEGWHHILVRWNHAFRQLEFIIDGKVVHPPDTNYINKWPKELGKAFIGNWTNLIRSHHLNMPLFRVIVSTDVLPNMWLKEELKKKPSV